MRHVEVHLSANVGRDVYRVVAREHLAADWAPDLRFLVLDGIDPTGNRQTHADLPNVGSVIGAGLEDGDVVAVDPTRRTAAVLLRATDRHQSLLLTNRCNSRCLMCSQPPTPQQDAWLAREAIEAIRHLRRSPEVLGLTGGEPLLLGQELRRILDSLANQHPKTAVEVLTNGRLLADTALASSIIEGLTTQVTWLVPLYGHADFLHDFVVQCPGAFDETISGLLFLQSRRQRIQLRIVLIEPVLRILPDLCAFIGRNLPFVREVALMACEPIGYALANRHLCEVDLLDWEQSLLGAATQLRRHRVPFIFMNTPLCSLPESVRPTAMRSISEWKNVFASECTGCEVRDSCAGLFAWHEAGWAPTRIHPITRVQA